MTRRSLILVGLGLALGVPALLVAQKEYLLREGEQLFLQLAPVDPRSLMQGDFMRLSYAVSNEVHRGESDVPADGLVVLAVDAQHRGTYVRFDDGTALGPNEVRLRYRRRHGFVRFSAEAFYFQEGQGARYAKAKYGELRVTGAGDAVLVGLRGQELEPLPR
jgi:uncharacterized membrane-anchored protein